MTNEEEITMDKRPIGVFDSGVGGLTVVKQIMKNIASRKHYLFWRYSKTALWHKI